MKSIEDRIKDAEDSLPVPAYKLREAEALIKTLKEENERLKDDLVSNMIAKEEHIAALEDRCATAESEVVRLDRQNNAIKARVAELKGLVRDIKQHDIDETTKRILDGGRKFNFSLPLNIRERIADAIKEPANEG